MRKYFRKTYISYPVIRIRTCVYQGVKNVSFSENFACILINKWSISPSEKVRYRLNLCEESMNQAVITLLVQCTFCPFFLSNNSILAHPSCQLIVGKTTLDKGCIASAMFSWKMQKKKAFSTYTSFLCRVLTPPSIESNGWF